MKVLQGTVVDGRIVVDGPAPREGVRVTIVDEGNEEPYRLSAEEEAALEEADAEIERGEYVTAAQLLDDIARARG